ncbi:MAG TPA: hypothetical protein VGS97_10525 [Actinocrinis sp.]|uniref:hypothetical protein n=1 Tax=Actinocrinis sp. TaxID=1920516 RepID=UPI002DDD51A2|nr:hypothetical protein [Actinocrinis sp.]HEV2344516.1 hypothetical protein [Actinocrinis sp.]
MIDQPAPPDPDEPDQGTDPEGDAEAQVEAILAAIGAEDALKELDRRRADQPDAERPAGGGDSGEGGRGPSQATKLVELARRDFRTVLGSDGKTYAVLLAGPNLALSLRGENGLRSRLAKLFFDETQTAPGASALADALNVLEGQAVDAAPEPVALRVARHEGNLILDLGQPDGRCVVISPGEWHVEPESPVLFRRTRLTAPLPVPSRTVGGLDRLRELLNVGEAGFRLLVAWLVATVFPDIPHPILALSGEQGTGKSAAGRALVSLLDPSPAPLRAAPKDMRAWTVQAAASWTVMLDNVSSIPAWFSDTLCKAVTGDGMVERALYTDDDVSVLSFQRVIGMTTIDAGAMRGDLAERLLLVELEPIRPDQRRTDEQVKTAYETGRPAILGAILDLTAAVLAVLPDVQVDELPRLADFAKILAAIDQVNGWTTFNDFTILAGEITEAVIEADPFADAVRTLIQTKRTWTGTAAALAELLTPHDPPKTWPRTPRAVAGHLRRVAPALRKNGIAIDFLREANGNRQRLIRLAAQ